jgi:hypothetical protein
VRINFKKNIHTEKLAKNLCTIGHNPDADLFEKAQPAKCLILQQE